ncbi:MAG: class I SAM-dependent methyltransferase [Actinomycetota bacterium]|nr:class I SAM-dependent methyltransferase [Actinomycetota bacterium]
MELRKSDYETYDYREFWQDNKRQYEDYSERLAIRKLLKDFTKKGTIADVGCGFGRLFNEYNDFEQVIMMDYSVNNLKNTINSIKDFYLENASAHKPANIYFIAADAENIPLKNEKMDMIISVRLMHHLNHIEKFINEISRVLKQRSVFILEFANKKNLKNILKFTFGRTKQSPFSPEPLYIGDTIRNYHPKEILKEIKKNDLYLKKIISVSNFRADFLKTKIKTSILKNAENAAQNIFSFLKLGPSIFIKAFREKEHNTVPESGFSELPELIMCPSCRDDKSLLQFNESEIICSKCTKRFKIIDGIYDLRIK